MYNKFETYKLKLVTKDATKTSLKKSSNTISNSNDETNFPHKLSLTDRQVASLSKSFANNLSANIELSKM